MLCKGAHSDTETFYYNIKKLDLDNWLKIGSGKDLSLVCILSTNIRFWIQTFLSHGPNTVEPESTSQDAQHCQ